MEKEEIIRLILESPNGLEAFQSWMKLQWFVEICKIFFVLSACALGAWGIYALIKWAREN